MTKFGCADTRFTCATLQLILIHNLLAPGGAKPNLADLAVFGVLKSIRYLRAGQDMVQHTRIGDWYDRMENAVGVSAGFRE